MNIQKLEALITAIDLGSFSRAAERLGYTQSGLTHMMNSLEAELGFALIERGYFGVRPTKEGARVLSKIRHLVAMGRELSEDIRRIREGEGAALRIGAYSSVAMHWLPSIIESFRTEHPGVAVEVAQGSVSELYGGIASGRFDLAFVSRNDRYLCEFIPLRNDRLLAILPPSYPIGDRRAFPIGEFEQQDFLMPSFGFDIDIASVLCEHGVAPHIIPTLVDDPAIVSMVEHGLGASILSELCLRGQGGKVLCLPIAPDVSRRLGIALAVGKRPTEIMQCFIGHAKKFTERFEAEE